MNNNHKKWGSIAQLLVYLLPDPAALSSIPKFSEFFSYEEIVDVARLINGAAYRKVDSGLKMMIEPIYWL